MDASVPLPFTPYPNDSPYSRFTRLSLGIWFNCDFDWFVAMATSGNRQTSGVGGAEIELTVINDGVWVAGNLAIKSAPGDGGGDLPDGDRDDNRR